MATLTERLFAAIEAHDHELVRYLLKQKANSNAPNPQGWRPLHIAVGRIGVGGPLESVELLLDFGADPNAWDLGHNETALLTASDPLGLDTWDAARVLLESGADPNVRRSDGESALRLAARGRALDLAKLLLKHGAAKTIDDFGGDWCWTALGHAAHNADRAMIQLLLNAGARTDASDDSDLLPRDRLPPRESMDPALWDELSELLGKQTPDAG